MPDPTLFHGIAVVIDDEIDDPRASVQEIQQAIERENCHVIGLSSIPEDNRLSNLRSVAFFVLDWNLYGTSLNDGSGGTPVPAPAGVQQENEDRIVSFLTNLKNVRCAPVFIFTDSDVDTIRERLRERGLYHETDKSHILVMTKRQVMQDGVFNVLSKWMETAPSVYVLKEWERAYEKAKNEMFVDFYVKGPLWPMILWQNFEQDGMPSATLMGELIGRNLTSRMTPFTINIEPFGELLSEIKKDEKAYGEVTRKVLEGERFLGESRLDKGSFEPGDIFQLEDGYRINIRPDCDCIPKGNDTLDGMELYLLKGTERPAIELKYEVKYGLIPEQDNESVVFPVYDGKALCFKFRKLLTVKWKDLKGKRIGRLLPPFLTRLQQRYSSYLQRPGLNRLPAEAIPSAPQTEATVTASNTAAVAGLGARVERTAVDEGLGETAKS